MISLTQKDIDRFWGKVDKEKSTTFYNGTRCWEWTAGHFLSGYGAFWVVDTNCLVHRTSWIIAFGEIPDGLLVLHHCDNRSCCSPLHLFLGNHQENVDDMMKKNRHHCKSGEDHSSSKLTYAQVSEIRERYGFRGIGGEDSVRLSQEFGVSSGEIRDIVKNKVWAKK